MGHSLLYAALTARPAEAARPGPGDLPARPPAGRAAARPPLPPRRTAAELPPRQEKRPGTGKSSSVPRGRSTGPR